jgi:hypothetical protein
MREFFTASNPLCPLSKALRLPLSTAVLTNLESPGSSIGDIPLLIKFIFSLSLAIPTT